MNNTDMARKLEDEVNDAFTRLQTFKNEHPETRNGFYNNVPGSWLNAYREGDLSFDDAVKLIEMRAAQRKSGDENADTTGGEP